MITAARLRDYNPKIGNKMRTYTSSRGNKYEAGNGIVPSAWRVIKNQAEIAELSEEPQFQIMQFENYEALDAKLQADMEDEARKGNPPVRAAVRKDESTTVMSRTSDESRSASNQQAAIKEAASKMLRPTPIGDPVDEPESVTDLKPEKKVKPPKEVKPNRAKKTGRRASKKKK